MMNLADSAHRYAAAGWPVFPLAPKQKKPLLSKDGGGNGLHDATTDLAQVDAWWTEHPEANIGLRTGVVFDVLDIDSQDGADALNGVRGDADGTTGPLVGTGHGWHLYFRPTGIRNRAGAVPGVDFRGEGGYVVAPPSVHPDGSVYEWFEGPGEALTEMPEWLRLVLNPPRVERAPGPAPDVAHVDSRYLESALRAELGAVATAPEGQRNARLNKAAFSLGQFVAARRLAESGVYDQLLSAATAAGLGEAEARKTIESGLAGGKLKPRVHEL